MHDYFQKIHLYNSLNRAVEEMKPLKEGHVGMYTCGPTVYDSSHIGHARSFIVWDVLVRYMKQIGFNVTWVRNITDIDDKIINRAKNLRISPEKLARMETFKFWSDMQNLNIEWPDYEPRATENLEQMNSFIQGLIDKDYAYKTSNNDVYFRVCKFKDYGQLKKVVSSDSTVARIDHLDCKEHEFDFALWKGCSLDDIGFDSPFGYGRPGWHLECSAMIEKYLGETIDIHTGGEDLIFPHHENEIAQSEALHGKKFANYWLHNGMIMVDGKKMSKSEGNFVTIRESLSRYSNNAIRFFVLSAHYRQPVNYTEQSLQGAQNSISKLFQVFQSVNFQPLDIDSTEKMDLDLSIMKEFYEVMSNDLNTPQALAILFDISKRINKGEDENEKLARTLWKLLSTLGFDMASSEKIENKSNKSNDSLSKSSSFCDFLLQMRRDAKEKKDFAMADKIRLLFEEEGYKLKDCATGTELILG